MEIPRQNFPMDMIQRQAEIAHYNLWRTICQPQGFRPEPTQFEKDCQRVLYLIATGYADDAGELASAIATKAYDEKLDRRFCDHTGYPYFYDWLDDDQY